VEPIVTTSHGRLRGSAEGDLAVFRGIPFAAPPVGERRWRPPAPAVPWEGTRDALEFGPASLQVARAQPQSLFAGMFGAQELEQSEDCLYLNVWTPGLDGARRPVMVWIHGGAFRTGTGASPMYDGARLAQRGDVVVVTINYRLGALGLLWHEPLGGGNFAILDQVAALEWVQRNVEAFGGDPGNVTIFGESAGGKSVETLLATPRARGLFHRAIAQSTYDPAMTPESARPTTEAILAELGVPDGAPDVLRALPAEQVIAAQASVQAAAIAQGTPNVGSFVPIVDGDVVPRPARDVIEGGEVRDIPLLIGTTRDEWKLFASMQPGIVEIDDAGVLQRLAAQIPDEVARTEAVEACRGARTRRGDDTSPLELLSAITTDRTFRYHSTCLAEAQRRHQPQTFMYLFSRGSEAWDGRLGACHALELPFVFGTFESPLGKLAGDSPENRGLSERMQDAWIAFARTGDPNTSSLPPWPAYDAERRATMVLDRVSRVEDGPMEEERAFWAAQSAREGVSSGA
jgi:para-nitrobenzyl esterase